MYDGEARSQAGTPPHIHGHGERDRQTDGHVAVRVATEQKAVDRQNGARRRQCKTLMNGPPARQTELLSSLNYSRT